MPQLITRAACPSLLKEHQERLFSLVGQYMEAVGEIEPDEVGESKHIENHERLGKIAQAMTNEHEWFHDNCKKLKELGQ